MQKCDLNRIYWEYNQSGIWWRPEIVLDARVSVPRYKYKNCHQSIKLDMVKLVHQFNHDYHNRNIYIAMSGGIDSELVADTFYQLGIPFTGISLNLWNANFYDIIYARDYCYNRSIPYKTIYLSEEELVGETISKAVQYGQFTHSLSQVALTKLVDSMSETDIIIFSGHNPDFSKYGIGWWEDSANLVKYAINTGKNFFTFTSLETIFMHYAINMDLSKPGHKDDTFIYLDYPHLKKRTKKTGWETLQKTQQMWKHLLDRSQKEQIFLTWK